MFSDTPLPFVLQSIIAPLFTVFLVCGAGIRFRFAPLCAIGLAAACIAPLLLAYPPAFPPAKLLDYVPLFGVAAFLIFLPFDIKNLPLATLLRWPFSFFVVWILLRPKIAAWPLQDAAANLTFIVLIWASLWQYIDSGAQQRRNTLLMLAIIAGGMGIALSFSTSVTLGKMGIALGIALASWLLLTQIVPELIPGHSGIAMIYTLFACLFLISVYYSELPRAFVLLVLSAFMADPLTQMLLQVNPEISERSAMQITAGLAFIPISFAIWYGVGGYFIGG